MNVRTIKPVTVRTNVSRTRQREVISRGLRTISKRTIPLYSRIARDRSYATRLVLAVKAVNFNLVKTIIRQEFPGASAEVGAGFNACLDQGSNQFCVGIFRPGKNISTAQIRSVSRIMLPLLRKIAVDPFFTAHVADLVIKRQSVALLSLVRKVVKPTRVISAPIDEYGFNCIVKLPSGVRYNFVVTIAT